MRGAQSGSEKTGQRSENGVLIVLTCAYCRRSAVPDVKHPVLHDIQLHESGVAAIAQAGRH